MPRSQPSRSAIEEAFLSPDDPPPWGGSALNEAIRLATRMSTRTQLETIGQRDCADLLDDVYTKDEEDFESNLIRESFKHGVLVDSSEFYELLLSESNEFRARRFVLMPNSTMSLIFGVFMTLFTLGFCGLVEPFIIGFDYEMRLTIGTRVTPAALIDLLAGIVFTLDMVLNFVEAKVVICRATGRRTIITKPKSIARVYLKSFFAMDAITNIPFFVQIIVSIAGESHIVWRLTRLLRIVRLFRLLTAQHVSTLEVLFMKFFAITPMVIYLAQIFLEFVVLVHVVACVYVYTALAEDRENSWLSLTELHAHAPDGQIYITALYFATATIATVGFGDVGAVNTTERVVITLAMFIGAAAFASLVGAISSSIQLYSLRAARQRHYRQFITRVHAFLDRQRAPTKLRRHILSYVSEVYPRRMFFTENEDILSMMPSDLRDEMGHHMLRPSLSRVFGEMPHALSQSLASLFDIQCIEPGVVLPNAGPFFIITEGAIVVSFVQIPHPKVAAVLTPGSEYLSYFGIDALTPRTQRTVCKVSSLTVCEIWRIRNETKFRQLLSRHPELVRTMIRRLQNRTVYDQDDLLDEREQVLKDFLRDLSVARDV